MKLSAMIKILLSVLLIFIFFQSIFVSWAQQDENLIIREELILPTPSLPVL